MLGMPWRLLWLSCDIDFLNELWYREGRLTDLERKMSVFRIVGPLVFLLMATGCASTKAINNDNWVASPQAEEAELSLYDVQDQLMLITEELKRLKADAASKEEVLDAVERFGILSSQGSDLSLVLMESDREAASHYEALLARIEAEYAAFATNESGVILAMQKDAEFVRFLVQIHTAMASFFARVSRKFKKDAKHFEGMAQ